MHRVLLAAVTGVAIACARAPSPPPPVVTDQAPPPREVTGGRFERERRALEETTHETGRIVHLAARAGERTYFAERYLLSPDDAGAVAGVTLVPSGEPALVVRDLSPARRGAAVRLLARGQATRPLRYVSARGLLVDGGDGAAEIIDVDSGGSRAFPSVGTPAVSPDGGTLAAVDATGSVRLLDAATLAERVRAHGVKLAGKLEETVLEFPAASRLLVTQPDRAILVDVATGDVLYDAAEESSFPWNRSRTSPSGRYLAVLDHRANGGFASIALLDTEQGGRPVAKMAVGMAVPAFAFSPDERTVVSSLDPGTVVATDLHTGAERKIRTGHHVDSEGYAILTDGLGFDREGRLVCGHMATSIGKYTDCHADAYVDLRANGPARAKPGDVAYCFVYGDTARFVSFPRAILNPKRTILPTGTATYTRICNENLSGDGATFALVDAASTKEKNPDTYEDVQLMLIDVREKRIRHRVPLGSGPAVMGAALSTEFSPSGRWLSVQYGEGNWTLVDVQRGTTRPGVLPQGRVTATEHLYIGQDDGVTVVPLPDGAPFALDPTWGHGKLAEAAGAKEAEQARERSAGAWAEPEDAGRVRTYRSTKVAGRTAALVAMDQAAASVAFLPDGQVELVGPKADARLAAEGLVCAFGALLAPFELCAERDQVTGAWESALAGP